MRVVTCLIERFLIIGKSHGPKIYKSIELYWEIINASAGCLEG